MKAFKFALAALAIAVAPLCGTAKATVNIVVATEDADKDTVPRDNRIYDRVLDAIREQLNAQGFQVYDETAAGMQVDRAHRVRRQDTELIEVARALRPPMDAIVVFRIYASVVAGQYTEMRRPVMRITSRVLNVRSGQVVGQFDVGDQIEFPPLLKDCAADRECLLESLGSQAHRIAGDLGAALAMQLEASVPGMGDSTAVSAAADTTSPAPKANGCDNLQTGYHLEFNGFKAEETRSIEQYLVKFRCYQAHRVEQSGLTYVTFWYETASSSAVLLDNLTRALDWEHMKASVSMSGNTYKIDRVVTR